MPRHPRAEAARGQHRGQRGRRVVRVVPVPERVPLPAADDRVQRVVLQQQHSARGHPGRPLGEGRRLVRGVHQAEAVDDHIGRLAVAHRREPVASEQPQPGAAVRAAVLGDPASGRQQPCRGDPLHRVGRLGDERGRLGAPGLLGHGRSRPPAGPDRTTSTATSAAGTPDRGPGRRTAGSSRRPAAHPDQAPDRRSAHGMPGRQARPSCPLPPTAALDGEAHHRAPYVNALDEARRHCYECL